MVLLGEIDLEREKQIQAQGILKRLVRKNEVEGVIATCTDEE